MVTLVYEARGLGARNVLGLVQLASIRAFEAGLVEWSVERGVCYAPDGQGDTCADSLLNYLYPSVGTHTRASGARESELHGWG